jgi:large subunit ribosomal protein L3
MSGLLGIKKGMTQIFEENGNVLGVTVLEAGPCTVTQVKTMEKDGYCAIQMSFGKKKKEIRSDKPEEYKVGQELKADLFQPGEMVKVSGRAIGKGFAGIVKRYHARRGPMSHGSKSHRIPGSISSGTTPGRVRKGKKMPGRMGGGMVTNRSLKVVQVIPERNLLLLKGSVPGKSGNLVLIRKA